MNPTDSPQNPTSTSSGAAVTAPENERTGDRSTPRQNIRATARAAGEQIKRTATETASQLKEQAQKMAEERKEQAARRLESYGSAAHHSAEEIEREDPNIGWLAHQVADRLQGAANYVRNRDFSSLRSDAETCARNHPAAFFGGLFVVGLILGNVVKATGQAVASAEREMGSESGSGESCGCEQNRSNESQSSEPSQSSSSPSAAPAEV